MSCTNTTAMYLNVPTDICANATASRSGNTITVSGSLSVTQGNAWNYNAIYAYVDGVTSWTKVKPYKSDGGGSWSAPFSFSFDDPNAGTRSYNAIFQVFNNAETGTVGNSAAVGFSVSYNAGATAPSGLSLTNVSVTQDTVTGTVSVTDWGGTGDANSRYRNLSVMQTNDKPTSPRRYQRVYGNTMSSAILVNNSTQYGSMTIKPNTRYWLWWYATNGTYGTGSPETSTRSVITMPPTPSVSDIAVTTTTATVTYSVPDQGGGYTMTLRYRLDGGGSTIVTDLSGSGTKTGTFTISGLTSSSSHTLTISLHSTSGDSVSSVSSFTTNPVVTGLYGPVKNFDNIASCTIDPGTSPAATAVNTSTLVGWLKTRSQFLSAINEGKDLDYINVMVHKLLGTNTCYVTPFLTDGTHVGDRIYTGSSESELAATVLADTGITIITDQSTLLSSKIIPSGVEYVTKSKTIDKLYGSVGGQTKQIDKLYGSVNGQTKLVYEAPSSESS